MGPRGPDGRVVVIAIHFGQLPPTIDLWLKSVGCNPEIDFVLVTDQPVAAAPANLRVIASSLDAVRRRSEAALDTPIALERPYKLCDLRPMYGLVFAEEIGDAAYWGHSDLDLMFGRIAEVLPEAAWGFDKILVRGNFSLYRNTPAMNGLFRDGQAATPPLDWREVLASEENRLFDEWAGIFHILEARGIPIFRDEIIADIDRSKYSLRRTRAEAAVVQELFYWEDGHIFGATFTADGSEACSEYLLIHLQKRALTPPDASVLAAERIYFTPNGFAGGSREPVDRALARRINPTSVIGDARIFARRARTALRRKLA